MSTTVLEAEFKSLISRIQVFHDDSNILFITVNLLDINLAQFFNALWLFLQNEYNGLQCDSTKI